MSVEININNDIVEINEVNEVVEIVVTGGIGPAGPTGQGVPTGGTTGQALVKLSNANFDTAFSSVGTVTSVNLTAGTGISVSGGPITVSGNLNVVNTAPDQVVSLTGSGTTTISGTYPNFTITSADSTVGTVTSVNMTVPTGLVVSGNPITSAGTLAIALQSGFSIPLLQSQATWDVAFLRSIVSAAVTGTTTKTLSLNREGGGAITASWTDINTVNSVFGRTGVVVATNGDYTTSQVTEATNLYFLDSRARASISAGASISYNNTTGVITNAAPDQVVSITAGSGISTSGTYPSFMVASTITQYTDALSRLAISLTTTGTSGASIYSSSTGVLNVPNYTLIGLGGVSLTRTLTINGTAFDLSSDRSYNVGTVTSVGLSSATSGVTIGSSPITTNGTITLAIATASGSQNGLLSSADFTTFNNKQAAGNYITALTGEVTASGPSSAVATVLNSAVIGKVLTGLNLTSGGTIANTDSILQAFGKTQNQISALVGGVNYDGVWNASTNTPAIVSSVGSKGDYYVVNVAGSTNINGITDWKVGDWIIFNGSVWDKVDNTDAVSSVNSFVGAVSLTTANISEVTNQYYLDSRARLALSFIAGSGAYNSTTGEITIPTNNNQIANGSSFITLTSLSAGTGISYSNTTGVISNTITQYTDALARASISLTTTGTSGAATYNNSTGVLNVPNYANVVTSVFGRTGAVIATNDDYNTSQVTENVANLFYTEARVNANTNVSANTAARHNALTISTANGLSLSVQALSLALASTSVTGALSSTDFNTFNNKQSTISLTTTGTSGAATFSANTLNIPNYTLAGLGGLPLTGGTLTGALTINNGRLSLLSNTGDSKALMLVGDATFPTFTLVAPNTGGTILIAGQSGTGMTIGTVGQATFTGALTGTSATFSSTLGINGVADNVKSGTYTATLTSRSNVASTTFISASFQRIGSTVTVFVKFNMTATLSTSPSTVSISIPVGGNFTAGSEANGLCVVGNAPQGGGRINARTGGNSQVDCEITGFSINPLEINASFQYQVQ